MPTSSYYRHSNWLLVVFLGLLFSGVAVWVSLAQVDRDYNDDPATHWLLTGNLTSTSASFRVRNNPASPTQSLVISTLPSFQSPVSTTNIIPSLTGQLVQAVTVYDLVPATQYYYRLATPGAATVFQTGRFRTPAPEGQAFDFKVIAAGCAWSFSDELDVYNEMANEDADLFLHLGDMHYEDIDSDNMDARIQAVDKVLGSSAQRPMFTIGGLVYMWDDHDFTGNDSGQDNGGRLTALRSYQLAFPHYRLALDGAATVPVYHAFTYGTVRFVVSDLRSEATDTSIYSQGQKEWLLQEFSKADQYDFVVWVTTRPWIEAAEDGLDSWGGYAANRSELSAYISSTIGGLNGPKNLIAIASDSHMVAMDNGANTFYGTQTPGVPIVMGDETDIFSNNNDTTPDGSQRTNASVITSFPILQSGPMDRLGSAKGGPYTEGCHTTKYTRNHQYSLLKFSFDPDNNESEPCLDIFTYRVQQFGGKEQIFHRTLCGELFTPAQPGSGSCDMKSFEAGDIAMFSISMALWLFLTLFACCQMKVFMTFIVMGLALAFYFVVLAFGIAIPNWKGIAQFNSFPSMLVALCYMVALFFALGCMMYSSYKSDREEDEFYNAQLRQSREDKKRKQQERESTKQRQKDDEARRRQQEEEYQRELEHEDEYRREQEEDERRRRDLDRARQSARDEEDGHNDHSGSYRAGVY